MYDKFNYLLILKIALKNQYHVIFALMLRNIRTRYFGHGLGYLIAILWPLAHVIIIIIIYSYTGRVVPYGESSVVFFATGTIPFMVFSYLSRFMMLSVIAARPLLSFPAVKVIDVLISGAILEVISSFAIVIILILFAMMFDINFWPRDIVDACCALGASVIIGVGFGLFNGVIALALPLWATIYVLLTIFLWITSGVIFVASSLPEQLRIIASYYPTLLIVEWMRSAYYEGYGDQLLSREYVIYFGIFLIFMGLLIEKSMRVFLSKH